MRKKLLAGMMVATMTILLAGCTSKETSGNAGAQYVIGISQFAEHGSLDNCREGFLQGLEEEGIKEGENLKVMYDNAQADTGTAGTITDNFVSKKVDMICAIATPSAMSAYNATQGTDTPVIYTAVSDPVASGLAKDNKTSEENITGTSDILPVKQQLELIRTMLPEAKKIGILYTTSETNSESTIEMYKKFAKEYNFEIITSGVNTMADISLAATDLVEKVDCLSNLTDNTVVAALQTVLDAANKKKIPVFGSEIEQIKSGCIAAMGLDYKKLGKQTGIMAAKVLKGEEKVGQMPYESIEEASLYINEEVAKNLNISVSDKLRESATEVFDTITVE